jgi:prepilin-type N-terminal cleavage/methylation domain-containing protein
MRTLKSNKGFSLVELIVVVGLLAIMATMSLRLLGNIRSANIDKSTKFISDALSKQQMRSMSKEKKPYLYIYEIGGKYYYIISELSSYDSTTMGTRGKEIGSGMVIKYNNGSDHTIAGSEILKISYQRDGSFKQCPNNITIEIGSAKRIIKLNKETGRHVITNE